MFDGGIGPSPWVEENSGDDHAFGYEEGAAVGFPQCDSEDERALGALLNTVRSNAQMKVGRPWRCA
jgi:hypothetical protein